MIKGNIVLLSISQKVLLFLLVILILMVTFLIIRIIIINKKIDERIYNLCQNKGYTVKKNYDGCDYYIFKDNVIIKLVIAKIPKNSSVTVNSKFTWCLRWGGKRVGRSYPNMRYMNEIIPFLKLKCDSNVIKLIALYPHTEKIQKYLNESEIAVVNSGEEIYDYVIINFSDIDSFLVKNK